MEPQPPRLLVLSTESGWDARPIHRRDACVTFRDPPGARRAATFPLISLGVQIGSPEVQIGLSEVQMGLLEVQMHSPVVQMHLPGCTMHLPTCAMHLPGCTMHSPQVQMHSSGFQMHSPVCGRTLLMSSATRRVRRGMQGHDGTLALCKSLRRAC